MPKLVSDDEVYKYLGIDSTDDPNGNALAIRDSAEELLGIQTGQIFGPAGTITREQHDGQDQYIIYANVPISSLTKIEFLFLPDVTQELYFNLDILNYVTYQVGKRRIHSRTYKFPMGINNVLITYNTMANTPRVAWLAVQDVVALVYRAMGSEDARSEQKGTFQHTLVRSLDESKAWSRAIDVLHIPTLG